MTESLLLVTMLYFVMPNFVLATNDALTFHDFGGNGFS